MQSLEDDQDFDVHFGDVIPFMMENMGESSVDEIITSPPFFSVFSYTPLAEDMGNTEEPEEAAIHLRFMFDGLNRILKPGRVLTMHCNQIVNQKRTGKEGIFDFRGLLIRTALKSGFIFDGEWWSRRNPQAQAIRTKSRSLQFAGLENDRANSRGALPDILLKFVKKGQNQVAIDSENQISRNQWIEYAECTWTGIKETETLNTLEAKGPEDTRHICAMPLGMIDRLVRMFSNPGEIVFDPFTGIGSTGYVAIKNGRRFRGAELKPEYHKTALKNLKKAVLMRQQAASSSLPFMDEDDE